MHLKSRSGGGSQDVVSSNLNALLEEEQPFWCRVWAAVREVKRSEMKEIV